MPISTNYPPSYPSNRGAYVITGPTSGFGRATAFEVAKHGTVVLVGRDREKLDALQKAIQQKGGTRYRSRVTCLMLRVLDAQPLKSFT